MSSIPSYTHFFDMDPIKKPYQFLNTADLRYAPDFVRSSGDGSCCNIPNKTYSSFDPRLKDPARNITTVLDTPALQLHGVQPLNAPITNDIRGPVVYNSYSDIDAGQIVYYSDPSMGQLYTPPIYVIDSINFPEVFVDPMGAWKPQYNRIPIARNNTNISEYSFDRDQMEFREDLIALQSNKMNQVDSEMYTHYFG